jgi:hypothetical protein
VAAAANDPYREALQARSESFTFVTGTLAYDVSQQDVATVDSLTGTVGGHPNHLFTPTVDYTFTRKGIQFTGSTLPDDDTPVSIAYHDRLYYPRLAMDSRHTVRALVRCKAYVSPGGKDYSMSDLAQVLGNSLEMSLRAASGDRLVRPDSVSNTLADEDYTGSASIGRVVGFGPGAPDKDASGSLATWFVDFTLNVAGIHELDPVPAILTAPFTTDADVAGA